MVRFIWRSWWRNKQRLVLLLIGALIMGSGLSYLFTLSENSKGTIVNTLQKKWHASYDIVVRPPDAPSFSEQGGLIGPNYLSNLEAGITMDQYHEIQNISGVQVAAPVAVIGYLRFSFKGPVMKLGPGIYRVTHEHVVNNGLGTQVITKGTGYRAIGLKYQSLSIYNPWNPQLVSGYIENVLLTAIDPVQEAKLVGLDKATADFGNSRYFNKKDHATVLRPSKEDHPYPLIKIPVLINPNPLKSGRSVYHLQRVDIDYLNQPDLKKKMILMKWRKMNDFLGKYRTVGPKKKFVVEGKNGIDAIFLANGEVNPFTGEKIADSPLKYETGKNSQNIFLKASGIQYNEAMSPFPKRWPYAFQVHQIKNPDIPFTESLPDHVFRKPDTYTKIIPPDEHRNFPLYEHPSVVLNTIGFYDPGQLELSKDPLTQLPMETYRPARAKFVLDGHNQPVNPPKTMTATDNPLGLLTQPPTMLTTLDAAKYIIGDKPISAIRIRVSGVESLGEESQQKLERVAGEIEKTTGLKADITLGSSPQPMIIHVHKHNGDLGWIRQLWIHLGTAITIFHETVLGFSGLIAVVLAVAVLYVFATHLVSLLARRKEFAVLLALGWRTKDLVKLMFMESLLLGGFVAVVAWVMEWIFFIRNDSFSMQNMVVAAVFALLVYLAGAVWPAFIITKITPYEAMKTGEISTFQRRFVKARNRFLLVFNNLLGKFRRNLLAMLAIAMPTTLVAFFLFITFRLKGILYTTWLGQYVALQVDTAHYIAMGIALVIAILTTTEIMWQNVSERRGEFAILKALGWRNGSVRYLILLEGILVGIFAAIIGVGLAFLLIRGMYGIWPVKNLLFLLGTGVIPIVMGLFGSVIPGEIAIRVRPSEGMKRE